MVKLTDKEEAACLVYIETGNKSEAYRQAYDVGEDTKPETVWTNGHDLFNRTHVMTRVKELQAEHAKRHEVTIDSLTLELEQAKNLANSTNNAAAMTGAIMGKAKIHGLVTDKTHQTGSFSVSIAEKDAGTL